MNEWLLIHIELLRLKLSAFPYCISLVKNCTRVIKVRMHFCYILYVVKINSEITD